MAVDDPRIVRREPWQVRFVECSDIAVEIRRSWQQLEMCVGSLRGRKFVGAFDEEAGWYRACVREVDAPAPAEASLPTAGVPGGAFLRMRLRGQPPALYQGLPGAFDTLRKTGPWDPTRPSLELYRRHDLVDALLPITD